MLLTVNRCFNESSENPGTSHTAIAANNFKAIWIYFTAPILRAPCGAGTYSAVKLPEDERKTVPLMRSTLQQAASEGSQTNRHLPKSYKNNPRTLLEEHANEQKVNNGKSSQISRVKEEDWQSAFITKYILELGDKLWFSS
ncbi:hypothetical protein Ddye_019940 [Dipteronia dyeriana]|uniref:Uncharacterized protein n=1 Tax=Dipteronia dyeriana TaxID=168575 RepID=A0AAD9WWK4_9ROSI|nr:hypothetical protein Ddye_019940 [Dipteronia dyeriana]